MLGFSAKLGHLLLSRSGKEISSFSYDLVRFFSSAGKCKSSTVVREHLEREMLLSLNAMRRNVSALLVFNL